jgi:hypothetical protein
MENITENNRLIAEFMGYEKRVYHPNIFYSIPYLSLIYQGYIRAHIGNFRI